MYEWTHAEPMVTGETIQRRVNPRYPSYVAQLRSGGNNAIDFGVVNELQKMLIDNMQTVTGWRQDQLKDAFTHLSDAGNEGLPLDVRETHFDIAGNLVWNAFTPHGLVPPFDQWIEIWRRAGGL